MVFPHCGTGSLCRPSPEMLLAAVHGPQRGLPCPLGTGCCLCLSLFPDAVVGHGVGASVGPQAPGGPPCCSVESGSAPRNPWARLPDATSRPRWGEGQAPSHTLPVAPCWDHGSAAPEQAQSGAHSHVTGTQIHLRQPPGCYQLCLPNPLPPPLHTPQSRGRSCPHVRPWGAPACPGWEEAAPPNL